jgi:hypothetical protein
MNEIIIKEKWRKIDLFNLIFRRFMLKHELLTNNFKYFTKR